MTPPRPNHPGLPPRGRRGFTLVELLIVIVILAILLALLLPAINAAMRTAKSAAVGAEINTLAQALAAFKAKYGDYPPSRVYLSEDGNLLPPGGNTQIATGDITYAQLGQRSISIMRKFFPRAVFNLGTASGNWYDFNGDGVAAVSGTPQRYILQGHECLAFFLGGIPLSDGAGKISMTGFSKDPTNPFRNSIPGNTNYSDNRQAPFFEFAPGRLAVDPAPLSYTSLMASGMPAYVDTTGNLLGSGTINFYAYFSSYGNGGYDPNDVNFPSEVDANLSTAGLTFRVNFPIGTGTNHDSISAAPNPYTSTSSYPTNSGGTVIPPTFFNPQTFQIISSGLDGQYGLGGIYAENSNLGALARDPNSNVYVNTSDTDIRTRERDNVTNFHNGRLD